MSDRTRLDAAHAAMQADPGDDPARLRFFERLADGEMFLLLAEEARGERLRPEIFEITGGRFVLAFDREERLAAFARAPAPYAALSGRAIAAMLAGQGTGLGVNLDVAPSSILLPAEALDWLAATLATTPEQVEARIESLTPPAGLPEILLGALDTKLASAAGLAPSAWLAGVTYDHGGQGHMLAFVDALPGAERALANATGEALTFSGIEAGALDVGFFDGADPMVAKLAAVGLRLDLSQPVAQQPVARPAPGSDPDNPPILR